MDAQIKKQLEEYYTLWLSINHLYEHWAKKQGLSLHAFFVLYAIWDNGYNCSQQYIVKQWTIPKQTASGILKGFEAKGYIRFETDNEDKRNKQVIATQSGEKYIDGIIAKLDILEEKALGQMGTANRKTMIKTMGIFNETLKKSMESCE